MTKKELRALYREKRNNIDVKEKNKLDDLLLIQFQQMGFEQVDSLLSYWPMEHEAEPATNLYTRYLHYMLPQLQIAYPISNLQTCDMTAILTNDDTVFAVNRWGITEPKEGMVIDPQEIDLVFIPMLIYDRQGYRVGFGKGFYDRFLSRCRENVLKIGFSYFEPVENISDLDEYDIPLNYCITPDRIYEF
jgi:5-formyltetrahydrofolate cyclo-ligase